MFRRLVNETISDPINILVYAYNKISFYISNELLNLWLSQKRNVFIKGRPSISGRPIIDIRRGAHLFIGEGVTLNSKNKGYHINMHSPVKLMADRPGATIRIGDKTRIHGTCIHAYQSIEIGSNCLIAANCQIFDGNGHDISFENVANRINTTGKSNPIRIEDNVWIGANTVILPGVTIGNGSVISANSVVVKDVPRMAIAGGNPAVIIKNHVPAHNRISE